ncbi:TolB family protein [Polyangium aurulentum]|uniref:TolB family protein n=1 Tax=Polyangium aurulentum TaxID=2567896 RepID=UPI0010AEAF0D|nr:TolB family protein [Polyangium aurulentum]UQA56171.1 TolB family protein [Polyangium aurulentum]
MPPLRRFLTPLLVALVASACNKERAEGGNPTPSTPAATAPSAIAAQPSAPPSAAPQAPAPPPKEMPLEERREIPGGISFISERDKNREVYLIKPDGTGERRLTENAIADYNGPGSPDGASLLVIRVDGEEGPQQLFLQPLDGAAKPLGPKAGRVRFPSFSPDGRWVVFESDSGKGETASYSDIYRVGIDGSGWKRLTNNPEGNFDPVISPKGDSIVLVSSRDRVAELYRIKSDGSDPVRLTETPRDEWSPRFSPNGEQLAFVSDRDGADRVYLMPASGGPAGRASHRGDAARVVEDRPTFSPSGKHLAYVLRAPPAPSRVIIVDLANGNEVEVTAPESGQLSEPSWSPDGRHLAVTITRGQDQQIYLLRADGSGLTRLTTAPGGNWNPQWVPAPRKGKK